MVTMAATATTVTMDMWGAGKRVRVRQNKKADHHSWTETLEKAGDSQAVDIFDVIVGLWAHNARQDMCRACVRKEQTRESV
jgi:hypothetical protein